MQLEDNITNTTERKTLRDFTRLVLAFFGCLVVLSFYQYIRLYASGVLDSFLNKSLFILLLHHTGFTALLSLFLTFLFNFLEGKKARLGFKVVAWLLLILLVVETLLIEYYIQNYEILGIEIFSLSISNSTIGNTFLFSLIAFIGMGSLIYLFYRVTAQFYNVMSSMYPFTIVLFSLFLATLTSDKKPINENKTQHLISKVTDELFDFNKYEGNAEFPLLKPYEQNDVLGAYFELNKEKPNLVFLIVEGLGSDFVGDHSVYKGFTPFIDSLTTKSLYWNNYLSNTGKSFAAVPSILGSLPFGKNGFTNIEQSPNRHTLLSILKNNGYATSFNYGGNSALNYLDKFMNEERVDLILDKKGFGDRYQMQEDDEAGISLGYPDKEMFRKWNTEQVNANKPRVDLFLTLSTKNPFLIPNQSSYMNRVEGVLSKSSLETRAVKLVNKNRELFASYLYADDAIRDFFTLYKNHPNFSNTIFIITGSHNSTELPHVNRLDRYRVPFMIYSPLLKSPKRINSLASHMDVAPSLISLLQEPYSLKVPEQEAWLGKGLISQDVFEADKKIPLFRSKNNIQDYIYGNHFVSSGNTYLMNKDLKLVETEDENSINKIEKEFLFFKGVNSYVAANNKIIPDSLNLFTRVEREFTNQEIIWINSVFNGNNFDNAYETARDLAINNERERALLLCRYILSKIPGHADTEILMGRIYAWEKKYNKATDILMEAVRKYPIYADGYAALLDVYFWSGQNKEAIILFETIDRNNIHTNEIKKKLARAYHHLKKDATLTGTSSFENNAKIEALITSTAVR